MKSREENGKIRAALLALGTIAFGGFLSGCPNEGPFEGAGEEIDEAIDEIDDQL